MAQLPQEFLTRMQEMLGDEFDAFLTSYDAPRTAGLRVNTKKCRTEDFPPLVPGTWKKIPWIPNGYFVPDGMRMGQSPLYAAGVFYLQEPSAMTPASRLPIEPGERVLDLCAAPGGKSFAMAMEMGNRGDILSCDIHPHKLKLIENGAARLGITIVRTALADGRERHAAWVEQADVVLADVPCSGLGIIRKKPDIRWKDPAALAALPAIQRAILGNAAAYVRPGGVLVYSTCTVLPEENGGVVTDFLSGHPEFVKEDFDLPGIGSCSGDATLWPQRTRTDGFYICRMRRRA